jgi:hypothetical protein
MIDWTASMQQSFEYYTVNPDTWRDDKKITTVKTSSINRDSTVETLGSASLDVTESLGECYVRIYLKVTQNGVDYREPLGTFLVQTPSTSFDGMVQKATVDAYTPLLELKENPPPLGYSIAKNENIMAMAYRLSQEQSRAPVIETSCTETLYNDFVANADDTWITYLSDLIANAKYTFGLDEMGRILFLPKQETASLQPIWTYNDDNSSIIQPTINLEHDIYGIPNIVEVLYSNGNGFYYAKAINKDENSPISTVNRGREITHRVKNPDLNGYATQRQIDEYAERVLRELSSLEYTVTYTHGYCPVRVGDCVRLNYEKANLVNVKAKVISQSIKCEPGCLVTEKAVFTVKLWG